MSTDKCVILCVHAPIKNTEKDRYADKVLDALSLYANPLVFAGHTHMNRVLPPSETKGENGNVLEYVHAAAMGNLWRLKLCPDGSPAGYTIYKFEGNTIKDVTYKPGGRYGETEQHPLGEPR